MSNTFEFTVTIPAREWAELQRRLRFVEAALIQSLRGRRQLREWFTVPDLAAMGLPGLPRSRQGLLRRAHSEGWQMRPLYGSGGMHFELHFASLPRPAFEALLQAIVVALPPEAGDAPAPTIPPRALAVPLPESASAATPQWLLPLLRTLKAEPSADADALRARVASRLPPGVPPPTPAEINEALRQFGYAS